MLPVKSRSMTKRHFSLSTEQLATLFTQLKSMESAGLPAFQAIGILMKSGTGLTKALTVMQQQLKLGRPISEAGFRAGIFNDIHRVLIHAAASSGRLAEVYGQLASHYAGLSDRNKKVKSRLYGPAFVLIIGLFVEPLPAYISSEISGFDYLTLSVGRFLEISVGLFLLARLPTILRDLGVQSVWHRLQLKTPVIAKWIIKRQVNEFFVILALMLDAGIAFSVALPQAVASIKNSCLREQFNPALTMIHSGASVSDTLSSVPVINATLLQMVNSSEQSGILAGGMLQFTRLEAEAISRQDDALADWLPRLAYCIIVIWIAYSIIRSQFATVVSGNV
jgi:general secretion pathway protein F